MAVVRHDVQSPKFIRHGPKPGRAAKISEIQWEDHKSQLCELYSTHTLEAVREIMAKSGFKVSRRQLNYRFCKWGLAKYYKSMTPESSPLGTLNGLPPDPFIPCHSASVQSSPSVVHEIGDASVTHDTYLECIDMTPDHDSADYKAWGGTLQETGERLARSNYANAGHDGLRSGKRSPDLPEGIKYPFENDLDLRKKLAADFCSALSDDDTAFELYSELCQSALPRSDFSAAAKHILLISSVRSAQSPEAAEQARQLIRQQRRSNAAAAPFLFAMLDAYMMDRDPMVDPDAITGRIHDIVSGCLGAGSDLVALPHEYGSIDLVMYQFLSHGLDKYVEHQLALGTQPTFSRKYLLNQYVKRQPFVTRLAANNKNDSHQAVRSCVSWCRKQLDSGIAVPQELQGLPYCPSHRLWRDDIILFGSLWNTLYGSLRSNSKQTTVPLWYLHSESELGISASELLVTVCWILGDSSRVTINTPITGVFERANRVLSQIMDWSDGDLWAAFLQRFAWLNKVVQFEDDEESSFRAATFECIRLYISNTLQLPLTQPLSPVSMSMEDLGGLQLDFWNVVAQYSGDAQPPALNVLAQPQLFPVMAGPLPTGGTFELA